MRSSRTAGRRGLLRINFRSIRPSGFLLWILFFVVGTFGEVWHALQLSRNCIMGMV